MSPAAAPPAAPVPPLRPAAAAFDTVAADFDRRFGEWHSVAAQRRAVRAELLHAFAPGAAVLEVGGGTGEDAGFLADHGRRVHLTDVSPAMVQVAAAKLAGRATAEVCAAEALESLAARRDAAGAPRFDGAFSNFAALNCVPDLRPVARGLARLLRPGAPALLVVFGIVTPGEWVTEIARGRPRSAFRRLRHGGVLARLGGRYFTVVYHRRREVAHAFAPWFALKAAKGIGVFVPPSAAEPWISRHPRFLSALEAMDRAVARPLAPLGDHVLYRLERTDTPAPEGGE